MRSLLPILLFAAIAAPAAEGAGDTLPPITVPVWEQRFATLVPGQGRVEAEACIAAVRQVPTTYDLYAMDTSAVVAYRLDPETVLVVRYRPGTPAAHVSGGAAGGHPPVDGAVLDRAVVRLR
jgi:hypothetical protein